MHRDYTLHINICTDYTLHKYASFINSFNDTMEYQ